MSMASTCGGCALESRKQLLQERIENSGVLHFSDHYAEKGLQLLEAARQRGLEGIVARKRSSAYQEKRSSDWLKIKITQRQECVVGGYTDPEGSREYFGALVLGLYDRSRRLIHVGQVGAPVHHKDAEGNVCSLAAAQDEEKSVPWRDRRIAEGSLCASGTRGGNQFAEWTHETAEGGMKLRAPVLWGCERINRRRSAGWKEAVAS